MDNYAVGYALRNDLSGVWRVAVEERKVAPDLRLEAMDMFPTRVERFQAQRLGREDMDCQRVRNRIARLSEVLGTTMKIEGGMQSQRELGLAS